MRFLFCFILSCFILGANAQKYSNEFLNIGVSARAQAMGNAQVASINNVTAGYWNPAGLANIKDYTQVSAMHAEWFASVGKYDYLAVAHPLSDGKRVVGVSLIRFGIDDIPNTLNLVEEDGTINYDNVKPFSAADYAVMFSYAQPLGNEKLLLGANAKVVHRIIGSFANAWGFGFDAGLQYKMSDNLQFGLMAKDITTTFNAWNYSFTEEEKEILIITNNEVPESSIEITKPRFVLGAAYQKQFNKMGFLTEVNFNLTTDGQRNVLVSADPISIDPLWGLELNYNKMVYLRGGVNKIQKETDLIGNEFWGVSPNLGIGFRLSKLHINYAYTNVGESANNTYSHVISLMLDLNWNYIKNAMKNAQEE